MPDGTLDEFFDPNSSAEILSIALQTDGRILVGGGFISMGGSPRLHIARLNDDGTLDAGFNPVADGGEVDALAIQPDGKIVAGGFFTTLGGKTRNYIGRLANETLAVQELSAAQSGTAVTWLRSGASPELSHVSFESSSDGIVFTPLGEGTRISGGWELTGLALPRGQNLFIRAHGYYGTGWYSSSGSLIESVRNAYLVHNPLFLPLITR